MQKIAATWLSNSPHAPTGYGQQTALVVKRMIADGHKIAVASNYGLEACVTEWEGIPVYPKGFDAYSNDVVGPYFDDWRRQWPDHRHMQFTLYDVWVYQAPRFDDIPTVSWVPIDHMPAPPAVQHFLRKPNVRPIAMSKFGQRELQRIGIDCDYVPHAIDLSVFKPTGRVAMDEGKLMTGREIMGLGRNAEDKFVVGCFNANKGVNPSRKAWVENILAFAQFAIHHDDAMLFIYSDRDAAMGGVNLGEIVRQAGLRDHQVQFVHQFAHRMGIPNTAIAAMMTACDVGLLVSMGEGFGITAIEMQATGTRVILSDFSAQPELLGDGYLAQGQPWWDAAQGAWLNQPIIGSIVEQLEAAYQAGRGRSQKAIDFVAANYDVDQVYAKQWRPVLDRLPGMASADPAPVTWSNGKTGDPRLTIYIPTYQRRELVDLLASLAPQLTDQVELVVADNDTQGLQPVQHLNAPCPVRYERRLFNIGGDANILSGYQTGADWVWVIGDDDQVLPGAVQRILDALDDNVDRLILLSKHAPKKAAGIFGSIADVAARDPALPLAATLISANVVRRASLDMPLAWSKLSSKYGHAWAWTTCQRIHVLAEPCIKVGKQHAGAGVTAEWARHADDVKDELLRGYGLTPSDKARAWNYMSVET